jgi:lipid-A-disaccharide synthase
MEIRSLLPTMLEALHELDEDAVADAVLLEAPGIGKDVDAVIAASGGDARLQRVTGARRRRALASSTLAWTASGTATLECALLGVPMVVGYRLHAVTASLARVMVRVPNVALVNLIAGREIVPELLQRNWRSTRLARATVGILESDAEMQRAGLAEVRERLGAPGASRRAAEAVAEYLA